MWTLSTKGQQIFLFFFFFFLISSTSLPFQVCSLGSILVFWDVNFLSCFCFLLTFAISGAASRAECPFPVPEFPHFHVCLILVPHAFSHLSPSSCRHTHLWYFHVWGKKYTKHTKYQKIGYNCGYYTISDLSAGPRDYLPCRPGNPAVQPDWPHSAGHGGHVTGTQL